MTKIELKYILKVPALERKKFCEWCKMMFFKHHPDQIFCEECDEKRNDHPPEKGEIEDCEDYQKKDEHFAEEAERDKIRFFENSRGV